MDSSRLVVKMEEVSMKDVAKVGGKNASLGEMLNALSKEGISVPSGFVVTADAYREWLAYNDAEQFIRRELQGLDVTNVRELARRATTIRKRLSISKLPPLLVTAVTEGYREMEREYGKNVDVAVRSSATAEDLPDASFAGQQETYLGIRGAKEVLKAIIFTFASLFTERAIAYREERGYSHFDVALSVGVQKMVRAGSGKGSSGVMFTCDPESGFADAILITAGWGLGELVVQGRVTPDEFIVAKKMLGTAPMPIISRTIGNKDHKMIYAARSGSGTSIHRTKIVEATKGEKNRFALSNEEVLKLAEWATRIEAHYSEVRGTWSPMDIEWAKDGETGELYIVQARPETVQSRRDVTIYKEYVLRGKPRAVLCKGISVGSGIISGIARVITDPKQAHLFREGEILVSHMTDPDWGPIMKKAGAIVTDSGGRTSHAAIVSRELGVPAIVGARNATSVIKSGEMITIDVSGTDGLIYPGEVEFQVSSQKLDELPKTKTKLTLNLASPEMAFHYSALPVEGVGLAREEFIIASSIGIHPRAMLEYGKLPKPMREEIDRRTRGWDDPVEYYVDKLAYGIARIAAAFYPNQVIVRYSDFKSNEYAGLLGGDIYEPKEENPMIGWRGASRYYSDDFREAFRMENRAMLKVREEMGLTNMVPMVPFCRTLKEAKEVLDLMEEDGLVPNSRANGFGVPVMMMCEIPANVVLADEFLKYFDGFSIGSNDLTQLSLGLDRDSGVIAGVGNENDPAVRKLIQEAIAACKRAGKYSGICGQGPSDLPDFAEFLVREGIESMSLNPDTVIKTLMRIAEVEKNIY